MALLQIKEIHHSLSTTISMVTRMKEKKRRVRVRVRVGVRESEIEREARQKAELMPHQHSRLP